MTAAAPRAFLLDRTAAMAAEGMTFPEIARALGITETSVRQFVAQAKHSMQANKSKPPLRAVTAVPFANTVHVDKDIPVPDPGVKWPWTEIEVGDSFVMTGISAKSAHAMLFKAGKTYGRKFAGRKTEDGVRVWRVL